MKFLKQFPMRVAIVLAIQFVLGVYVNMYVTFPEGGDANAHWEFASTSLPVLGHIILGIAILFGSLGYLVITLKKKQAQLRPYAISGFVAVLAAFLGGESFVSLQDDAFSMLMAIGFITALLIYGAATRVKVSE